MKRKPLDPSEYGIDLDRRDFVDQLAIDFEELTEGKLTIDELVVRPRQALTFCDQVRERHGYAQLPDEVILRTLLNRRKASPRWERTKIKIWPPEVPPPSDAAQQDLFGQ